MPPSMITGDRGVSGAEITVIHSENSSGDK
jgi:hypothetical protein